ncbi:MAG TPA: GGDEF domain-containing protein, partial [Bacteroidota bacterium]|nr:GGDEF domain-containing protein [Bacteroidota bacterium]
SLHSYDVMGRLDAHTLGVLLINTPGSDGYLWAEKVRKLIASNILTVNGVTCSVTVSAGVCGLTGGMTSEQFLADASQVLQNALESGGNLVRVF